MGDGGALMLSAREERTMTDRELLEQWLRPGAVVPVTMDATRILVEALRARLAQPEQEPVAWRFYEGDVWCYVDHLTDLPQNKFEPLYTAPPQQHSEQWWKHEVSNAWAGGYEKGRASVKQEPEADVCCQDFEKCNRSCTPRGQWIAHVRCGCGDQIMPNDGAECGNCVTARNAVKEWVGLTDEEVKDTLESVGFDTWFSYRHAARAIEAKLKEKNT